MLRNCDKNYTVSSLKECDLPPMVQFCFDNVVEPVTPFNAGSRKKVLKNQPYTRRERESSPLPRIIVTPPQAGSSSNIAISLPRMIVTPPQEDSSSELSTDISMAASVRMRAF